MADDAWNWPTWMWLIPAAMLVWALLPKCWREGHAFYAGECITCRKRRDG